MIAFSNSHLWLEVIRSTNNHQNCMKPASHISSSCHFASEKPYFWLPAEYGNYLQYILWLILTIMHAVLFPMSENVKKLINPSSDQPAYLPFSLRWQSALFRKLDWSVWGLIYRSRMNTWMRSSAIFHTHAAPTLGWNIITAGPESGGGNRFSPEQALRCHVAHYSQYLTRCEIFSAPTSDFCWSRAVSPPAPHGRWTLEGETVSWVSTES